MREKIKKLEKLEGKYGEDCGRKRLRFL